MPVRRKHRLPVSLQKKLAVLRTFFAPDARRPVPRDKRAALALLVEYAGDRAPRVVHTESGRCYICTFPATWAREAIPGLGLSGSNKVLLCRQHSEELDSILERQDERPCDPLHREFLAIVRDCESS